MTNLQKTSDDKTRYDILSLYNFMFGTFPSAIIHNSISLSPFKKPLNLPHIIQITSIEGIKNNSYCIPTRT